MFFFAFKISNPNYFALNLFLQNQFNYDKIQQLKKCGHVMAIADADVRRGKIEYLTTVQNNHV